MALTEITFGENTYAIDRGDVGVLEDSCGILTSDMFLTVPTVGNVTSGVQYGPQDSFTGTSVGGGGGPAYYSYAG